MTEARFIGFNHLKDLYYEDPDYSVVMEACKSGPHSAYFLQDGFLFQHSKLCIPKGPLRDLLIKEARGGGLVKHFGFSKMMDVLQEHFYWPKLA